MEKIVTGKRQAELAGLGERMRLEWVHDSAFRFFRGNAMSFSVICCIAPTLPQTRHPPPTGANARYRRPVTIRENILPLGAVICAAMGRFPGQSPEQILADITPHTGLLYVRTAIQSVG